MFDRFQAGPPASPSPTPAAPLGRARVDLAVPYAQRADARALGARWDVDRRTWYVPEGRDPSPFARWLPPSVDLSGPSVPVRVIALEDGCWSCHRPTRCIVGVLVDDPELAGSDPSGLVEFEFVRDTLAATLSPATLAEVGIGPLRLRSSRAGGRYMSNGCVYCDAIQGDFPLREALREYREDEDDDLDALVVAEVAVPVSALPVYVDEDSGEG